MLIFFWDTPRIYGWIFTDTKVLCARALWESTAGWLTIFAGQITQILSGSVEGPYQLKSGCWLRNWLWLLHVSSYVYYFFIWVFVYLVTYLDSAWLLRPFSRRCQKTQDGHAEDTNGRKAQQDGLDRRRARTGYWWGLVWMSARWWNLKSWILRFQTYRNMLDFILWLNQRRLFGWGREWQIWKPSCKWTY